MRTGLLLFLAISLISLPCFGQEEFAGEEVGPSIKEILEKSLPPNPDRVIKIDPKTGTIFVRDIPSNQKKIAEILKDIDIGPQQITIESKFVEIKDTGYEELGINWGNTFIWYEFGPGLTEGGDRVIRKKITGGQTPGSQGNLVNFGDYNTTSGISFQISRLTRSQFNIILHALSQSNRANLLSAPKVTTINGQRANIQITRSVPYISSVDLENIGSANNPIWRYDYTTAEEEVGITLVVTPRVGEDSTIITLELEPEIEVLSCRLELVSTSEDLGWPVIDRRSAKTTVMVQSGETVVMGGLLDDSDSVQKRKVPILGDIPLLGNLFRHNYTVRTRKNLLIFVTASLINPEGEEIEY